ncbi:hypothetical protein SLS53_000647 [Cytospora paraplurivora]|uniref:Inositol-1-monophosphatase n=1 Tax=Cytospora paraplurivora TaxID=2898453 RepID=A0AAN9YLF9_9PEZI
MSNINLQEIQDNLVAIAFEAGRMILGANVNKISRDTKLNSVDIVTETDQAVEKHVTTRLQTLYPDYLFVGEETYVAGQTKITDAPTFIVDPIDGTTNFVHGFPNACISLGFAVDRAPAVGVVYNPFQDQLYTAVKGQGAYSQRNASLAAKGILKDGSEGAERVRLPASGAGDASRAAPLTGLASALVAVEWGSSRDGNNYDVKVDTFRRLAASEETGGAMVHSLRSLGSAALNLCAVAEGSLDLYWEGGCYAWDVCAGWCILSEAGGIVASGNPGDWAPELTSRVYLAVRGAPEGQKEIVEEFWKVIGAGKMDYKH